MPISVVAGLILYAAGMAAGGAGLLAAVEHVRRRQRMRRLTAELRSYRPTPQAGRVFIEGRPIAPAALLTAPLSGKRVLGHRVAVVQRWYDLYGKTTWATLLDRSLVADFSLESERSRCEVRAGSCELLVRPTCFEVARAEGDIPVELQRLLESNGLQLQPNGKKLEVHWYEALLEPDRPVTVFGSCARELALDGEPAGYRDAPTRTILTGTEETSLFISDRSQRACIAWIKRGGVRPPFSPSVRGMSLPDTPG